MTSRAITRTAGVCGLLLLLAAWGGSSGGSSTGAQPGVPARKLDRPFGMHTIETVRGVGYRVGPSP